VRFVDGAMLLHGPLPVVLYSFWAEESSAVGSARTVERTRALFGPLAVRGASAHLSLDDKLDHGGLITDVLAATIRDASDLYVAAELLDSISAFIGAYFADLDTWRQNPSLGRRRPARISAAVAR
jgi:hypothetical protein